MLPVTPEMQTPIQAAGGGPAAVNQSVERKQREWGLTCDVDPCCLEIHFFFFLLPGLHSQSFILASNMNKSAIVTL